MTLAPHPVCRSYRAGHHMHWIQWKVASRTVPLRARLLRVEDEDLILATDGGRTMRWWSHDPDRVAAYAEREAGPVLLYPQQHAMSIGNAWFNCDASATHSVCDPPSDPR